MMSEPDDLQCPPCSQDLQPLLHYGHLGQYSGKSPDNAGHHGAGKADGGKQDGTEQNAARHQHVYQQPRVRLRRGGEQQTGPKAADNRAPVEQPLDDDRSQPPYPRQSKGFLEEFSAKELAQPCRHDGIEAVADEQRAQRSGKELPQPGAG